MPKDIIAEYEEKAAQERRREEWRGFPFSELQNPKGWQTSLMTRILSKIANLKREMTIYKARGKSTEIITLRKKQIETEPDNIEHRIRLCEEYIITEDYDELIIQGIEALKARDKMKKSLSDRIAERLSIEDEKRDIPASLIGKVLYSVSSIFRGEYDSALEGLRDLITENPSHPGTQFLIGQIHLTKGDYLLAEMWHRESIRTVNKTNIYLKHITESRNEVRTVIGNRLLEKNIIVKEYVELEAKEREWNNTLIFRKYLGEQIQAPLTTELDDISIFRIAGKKTLLDMIKEGDKRQIYRLTREAAILLAKIHAFGSELVNRGLPPDTPTTEIDIYSVKPNHFPSKLERTIFYYSIDDPGLDIPDTAKKRILRAYSIVAESLKKSKHEYYKDHNPRNILIDDFGQLIAIDFETSMMLPCQIDLVSLLEFGSDYLTSRQKKSIIKDYLKTKRKVLGCSYCVDEFMYFYENARVQRHLELVGYISRDLMCGVSQYRQLEATRRQYHLSSALNASLRLLEMTTVSQRNVIKELTEGIAEIYQKDLEINSHQ